MSRSIRRPKRYKPEIIQVNLSNSFMSRTKCAVCGEEPKIYYYQERPYLFNDHRSMGRIFDYFKKWFKKMNQDWYLEADPKFFSDITSFCHPVDYKGYNPKLHMTKGMNPKTNVTQFISCWSGCSIWAFSDKANSNRPEFTNRKCKYGHPDKFIY